MVIFLEILMLALSPRLLRGNIYTPVLKELHWLPVERRIEYKMLLYTFKTMRGFAPEYVAW